MKLEWTMFANYAEEAGGLLHMVGATWDTINVQAPIEGAPADVVAVIQGYLIVRLLVHPTETDRDHTFEFRVIDADGHEEHRISGGFRVARIQGLPPSWEQGVNVILGLNQVPLHKFGQFTVSVLVNGQHVGDRPFRVLKHY